MRIAPSRVLCAAKICTITTDLLYSIYGRGERDTVIDFIIDVVFEAFLEGAISLWLWIFPGKHIIENRKKVSKVICVMVSFTFLAALIAGILLLGGSQGRSVLGWILMALGAVYFLTGLTLKIIFSIKK